MNTIKQYQDEGLTGNVNLLIQHPNRPYYAMRISGRSFQQLVSNMKAKFQGILTRGEILEIQDDIQVTWVNILRDRYPLVG